MALRRQLASFGLVGLVNTFITAATIAVLTLLGVNPILANMAGFGLGLMNSFVMNRRFTFKHDGSGASAPFAVSFSLAYALNIAVLLSSAPLASYNALIPQALGMLSYNVLFFILMKIWVFAGAAKT